MECLQAALSTTSTTAWVNLIAQRYGVSARSIWKDWANRDEWIPQMFWFKRKAEELQQWFNVQVEMLTKAAWDVIRNSNLDMAKTGAIAQLKDIVFKNMELAQSMGILPKVPEQLEAIVTHGTELEVKIGEFMQLLEGKSPEEIQQFLKIVGPMPTPEESK